MPFPGLQPDLLFGQYLLEFKSPPKEEDYEQIHTIIYDSLAETDTALENNATSFRTNFTHHALSKDSPSCTIQFDLDVSPEIAAAVLNFAVPTIASHLKAAGFEVTGGWGQLIFNTKKEF